MKSVRKPSGASDAQEVSYEINDALMRALFVALCRARGLATSYREPRAQATTVWVRTPDEATRWQLFTDYDELLEDFRDVVFRTANGFALERLGVPLEMD